MNRPCYKTFLAITLALFLCSYSVNAFFFGRSKKKTAPAAETQTPPKSESAEADSRQTSQEPAVVRFNKAYQVLVNADQARDNNNIEEALKLYREAWSLYMNLSKQYPDWQPGIIKFRLIYCDNQIESLLKKNLYLPASWQIVRQPTDDTQINEQSPTNSAHRGVEAPNITPEPAPASDTSVSRRITNQPDLNEIAAESKRLIVLNKTDEARNLLMKGISLSPDNRTIRILLGVLHCKQNEFENAMHILEPLIEENPSDAYAHMALGTAYFGLGRLIDASNEMESALKLNPNLGEAHFNLAQILLEKAPLDIESARYHYKKALELGSKPDENLSFLLK